MKAKKAPKRKKAAVVAVEPAPVVDEGEVSSKAISNYKTIKIQAATYDKLQDLVGKVSQAGWGAIGSARTDAPSQALVIDEALEAMTRQIDQSRR